MVKTMQRLTIEAGRAGQLDHLLYWLEHHRDRLDEVVIAMDEKKIAETIYFWRVLVREADTTLEAARERFTSLFTLLTWLDTQCQFMPREKIALTDQQIDEALAYWDRMLSQV